MHYLCDESNNDDKVVDEDEVEKNKLNIILASGGISQFASSSPCGHWGIVSHLKINQKSGSCLILFTNAHF